MLKLSFRNNIYLNFLILTGLIALLPFLMLTLYNHPSMDDFTFALRDENGGFFEIQKESYSNWSGRYFGTAIARLNPMRFEGFNAYKVYSLFIILLYLVSNIFLFYRLLRPFFNLRSIAAFTSLFIVIYLVQMPDIAQGMYWFMGYMAYFLADIGILFLLGILLKLNSTKGLYTRLLLKAVALLLAVAIAGSNELSMLILNASLLLLLITQWQLYQKLSPFYTGLFLLALSLGLVVVLAPGNYVRMDGQVKSGNLLYSLTGAGLMTAYGFLKWSVIVLIASILYLITWAIPLANFTKNKAIFKVSMPLALLWYIATLLTMNFVFIWSTGFRAGSRVENVIYFFFVYGWFFLLQIAVNKYEHLIMQHIPVRKGIFAFIVTTLFFLQTFNLESNVTTAYLDLLSGRAATFDRELNARYRYLARSSCSSCPITPVSELPKSLFIFNALRPDELEEMGINNEFTAYWKKSDTYLTGPTPAIPDNTTILKNIGKKIRARLFGIED